MQKKHAYLIICHQDNNLLKKIIELIDDIRNDIFIHVDAKIKTFDFEKIKKYSKKSNIIFAPRVDVEWAMYSLVDAELILFKTAKNNGNYDYYHLISGADLPLKSQNYIHNFFDNLNEEAIHVFKEDTVKLENIERYQTYYFFKRNLRTKYFVKYRIDRYLAKIQVLLKIKRNKNINFQKGHNWVSVTDEFVDYLLSKKDWIESTYKNTFCPDESYIQTIALNSHFKDRLIMDDQDNSISGCLREIDWARGNPYVFRENDYDMLKKSKSIFARKFDEKIDEKIINLIYNDLIIKDE